MSAKVKVDRELNFAHELIQPVFEAFKNSETLSSLHVCRGNWTKDESTLLTGSYDLLGKFFDSIDVNMLTLEFSTPRAGEIELLFKNNYLDEKIMLGLGVVNPRIDRVETSEEIIQSVDQALEFLPPERIWLNPDCGFATFANRPLNPYPIIQAKMQAMNSAATRLREKYVK